MQPQDMVHRLVDGLCAASLSRMPASPACWEASPFLLGFRVPARPATYLAPSLTSRLV